MGRALPTDAAQCGDSRRFVNPNDQVEESHATACERLRLGSFLIRLFCIIHFITSFSAPSVHTPLFNSIPQIRSHHEIIWLIGLNLVANYIVCARGHIEVSCNVSVNGQKKKTTPLQLMSLSAWLWCDMSSSSGNCCRSSQVSHTSSGKLSVSSSFFLSFSVTDKTFMSRVLTSKQQQLWWKCLHVMAVPSLCYSDRQTALGNWVPQQHSQLHLGGQQWKSSTHCTECLQSAAVVQATLTPKTAKCKGESR